MRTPEALFRGLLEAAPDAMVIVGGDGTIAFVNGHAEALFGYPADELLGEPVEILVPRRLRAGHPAHRAVYAADPRPRPMSMKLDLQGRRRDGTEFPVDISLSPLHLEDETLVMAAIRDVTDLREAEAKQRRADDRARQAEEALRRSEERYRLLFEKAGEAIYVVQAEGEGVGTLFEANESAAAVHGYTVAELVGRPVTDLLPAEAASTVASGIQRLVDQGWSAGESTHVRRYGAPFPVEWLAGPVGAPGARSVLVFLRDITERRHAVETLSDARDAAEAASRELEAFSYTVAHDLRQPLRGMSSFAEVLLEDYRDQLDAEGVDCLQEIRTNARRMALLIDALLSLSRVSRTEIRREPVDLAALSRAIVADLGKADPGRHVAFVAGGALLADADPPLVHSLLENLLANAWKFTARVPAPRIEIGVTPAGELFVRDNGAGFDMAYAKKLFAPFQRLHATADFPGTGIGLATAQRIVQRHGGRIRAEGAVGVGATFYFTLSPAADEVA